jgi:hypothetical protein
MKELTNKLISITITMALVRDFHPSESLIPGLKVRRHGEISVINRESLLLQI